MRIEKSILINTTPDKVWKVFTSPAVTKKMGGSYKTDWTPGSFFGWQNLSGTQITFGRLLEYRPGEYLKNELYTDKDMRVLSSVISYTTEYKNNHAVLHATEKLMEELTDAAFGDAVTGWEAALQELKKIAESL